MVERLTPSSSGDSQLTSSCRDLDHSLSTFSSVVQYYCVRPGAGQEEVTPAHFFGHWFPFVRAFQDQWNKEQHSAAKRHSEGGRGCGTVLPRGSEGGAWQ